MLKLTIKGNPISKKRPRFANHGKYTITYNDQKTEESRFLFELQKQLKNHKIITGPICVNCYFLMKRPKCHYGTGKNAGKLKKSAPAYHVSRPDIDNLKKFVFDCLNGEVWKDDSQIWFSESVKEYSDDPKTIIIITEAGDPI